MIRYAKTNNNFRTFEDKKSFFKKKLSTRGYSDMELLKASSSINFDDRQRFLQEKQKSPEIPLVFKTKYNPYFAGKDIKKAISKHWNIVKNNERLNVKREMRKKRKRKGNFNEKRRNVKRKRERYNERRKKRKRHFNENEKRRSVKRKLKKGELHLNWRK